MKYFLLEIIGWLGIGALAMFPALWLTGTIYQYGI